jgi:hypothetical protein
MAVVWPSKNNFANGDVLTATNMNNIGDTLNVFNPTSATNGQVWVANGSGSGAYATPAGAFTLIQSISLTSGTTQTISGIPGTYQQLFFRVLNCTVSGGPAGLRLQLNGVTTSTYKQAGRAVYGSTIGTNNYEASSNITGNASGCWLTPGAFVVDTTVLAQYSGWIPFYASASTNYKTVTAVSTGLTSGGVNHGIGESIAYNNGITGAITSVAVNAAGATFTGGTFQLYGVS